MNRLFRTLKNVSIILTLLSLTFTAYSQEKLKTLKTKNNHTKEEYQVRDKDRSIKEGSYKKFVFDQLAVSGTYHENKPVGKWHYYSDHNKINLIYDYTENKVDSFVNAPFKPLDEDAPINAENRPAILVGSPLEVFTNTYMNIRYPADARESGIQGEEVIGLVINQEGKVEDYKIIKSLCSSIDAETLRVLKLANFTFLPAIKNGKSTKCILKLPVKFKLG